MAVKSVLDSLEGLDPALAEQYSERQETVDGKQVTRYYLDIEDDIRRHPKGKSLVAALDRIKEEKKRLTEKLEGIEAKFAELPENFDAEQFAKDMDELIALRKKLEDKGDDSTKDEERAQSLKTLYEQRAESLKKKYDERIVNLENEKRDLESEIERLVADEGLTKHLHSVGVDKKMMPAVTALHRRHVKVRKEDDGHRNPIVVTPDGEVLLEEYIQSWAQSDEGQIFLEKPKGGSAPGGDGTRILDNPWVDDPKSGRKPNLFKQQQVIAQNPAKAKQMMQAAGKPQAEIDRVFSTLQ